VVEVVVHAIALNLFAQQRKLIKVRKIEISHMPIEDSLRFIHHQLASSSRLTNSRTDPRSLLFQAFGAKRRMTQGDIVSNERLGAALSKIRANISILDVSARPGQNPIDEKTAGA
jgi:hypothetical protein